MSFNIAIDNEIMHSERIERLMKYGMSYIATTDFILDDVSKRNKDFVKEYKENIRPSVLKAIKVFSEQMLNAMVEDKEKFGMCVNPDIYVYFLIGVRHYLDTNISYYDETKINVTGCKIEQLQDDFVYVDKEIQKIVDVLHQIKEGDEKDKS